jgi:hypothetical protein
MRRSRGLGDVYKRQEYMLDKNGQSFTYDVNTNTNYNSIAEKKAGQFGMLKIAQFLKAELEKL